MNTTKSVLYYVMPNKIINGTLFYVMEYFLVSNELTTTKLILKCDNKTFKFILSVFMVKYKYNNSLNNLIVNSNYTTLPKLINNNVLILDTNTYNKCKYLIKSNIFLYSENGDNKMFDNTYGFYNYQTFNRKTRLKLAFNYHKNYTEIYDTFESSLNMNSKPHSKLRNQFKNLMEYKCWYYKHNGFDTNNRFIPEARYFNKVLSHSEIIYNDSINDRLISPIKEFILTSDDLLIKDFCG